MCGVRLVVVGGVGLQIDVVRSFPKAKLRRVMYYHCLVLLLYCIIFECHTAPRQQTGVEFVAFLVVVWGGGQWRVCVL